MCLVQIFEIIGFVYQFLKLMRQASPQEWIFKELQDIGNMEFRFAEEQPQDDYAAKLAGIFFPLLTFFFVFLLFIVRLYGLVGTDGILLYCGFYFVFHGCRMVYFTIILKHIVVGSSRYSCQMCQVIYLSQIYNRFSLFILVSCKYNCTIGYMLI